MVVEDEEAWRTADYLLMSYSCAIPLKSTAVARAAGLGAPDPAGSSILKIGRGEQHHLLSLANRWPACGWRFSGKAIHRARSRARWICVVRVS